MSAWCCFTAALEQISELSGARGLIVEGLKEMLDQSNLDGLGNLEKRLLLWIVFIAGIAADTRE